jgi:hypothetical protein
LVLGFSALLSTANAVVPPPDGGYAGANTAEGTNALFNLTTGIANSAIGSSALFNNTTGSNNTATGASTLVFNTTGGNNTASGFQALFSNTTGDNNTAHGYGALALNTTGTQNTATGYQALFNNTTGDDNTATGLNALWSNTTGLGNTAHGTAALFTNTTGVSNSASGSFALVSNTTGSFNTAHGYGALALNTTGTQNTVTGYQALNLNTTGTQNTGNGYQALFHNTTGGSNIALGYFAGGNLTTGDNNIDIGNAGVAGESATIRIGTLGTQQATYVAGIVGKTVPHSVPVFINSDGKLGTVPSSQRFKTDIKAMDLVSEAILALKPVTFRYKKELDPEGIAQFGLVAEEVEKVNPDLVVRDADGKPYTVRYDAVNAMLLNEFLKEHRKVEQLKKDFESKLAQQQNQIDALTAGLQRTVAVETVGDNVKGAMDVTDLDGKSRHNEWTATFDGKDFPGSGRVNNQEKEQQL